MRIDPETIFEALFAQGQKINTTSTPLVTMSRRWVKWDELGDIPMPCFFQRQLTAGVSQVRMFGSSRYVLKAEWWFYIASDIADFSTPTSPKINAYFNAADAILQPSPYSAGGARQQLGLGPGLEHAWIDGTVFMDEGTITPPAILLVPITLLLG